MLYRFLGGNALVHDNGRDTELTQFGQPVELSDELAREILAGGRIPLIPDAKFEAYGFTTDELHQFATVVEQQHAPDSFKTKRAQAIEDFLKEVATASGTTKE